MLIYIDGPMRDCLYKEKRESGCPDDPVQLLTNMLQKLADHSQIKAHPVSYIPRTYHRHGFFASKTVKSGGLAERCEKLSKTAFELVTEVLDCARDLQAQAAADANDRR